MRRRYSKPRVPPSYPVQPRGSPVSHVRDPDARVSQDPHPFTDDDLECLDTILSATNLDDSLVRPSTLVKTGNIKGTRRPWVHPGYVQRTQGKQPEDLGKTSQRAGMSSQSVGCSCLSRQDLSSNNQERKGKLEPSTNRVVKESLNVPANVVSSSTVAMRAPGRRKGFDQKEQEILEEFVLDDNELCLLNFYDIPIESTKYHCMRKSTNLKTVSIIDTLSELALGATDRGDEPSSSNISHSATSGGKTRRKKTHIDTSGKGSLTGWEIQERGTEDESTTFQNQLTDVTNEPVSDNVDSDQFLLDSCQRRNQESKGSCDLQVVETHTLLLSQGKSKPRKSTTNSSRLSDDANSVSSRLSKHTKHRGVIDASHVAGSSLKRTLKQLRKAVSSTVVGEEGMFFDRKQNIKVRRHHGKRQERDYARLCLSDSEVRTDNRNFHSNGSSVLSLRGVSAHNKSHTCYSSLDPVSTKSVENLKPSLASRKSRDLVPSHSKLGGASRRWRRAPEWIRSIFSAAAKGDLEMLQNCLKDMDVALIRNLSDRNGNNLWHVCCSQNHLHCLKWLCNEDSMEALKDQNKNGLTPVLLATKHGNMDIVQWLLKHTACEKLLEPSLGERSLLHYAAKYGQEQLVHWLAENMQTSSINCRDSEGNSSLHFAAKYGHIGCAKALILHSADITAKNELGLRPYDLAIHSENHSCADYLIAMESCLSLSAEHLLLEGDVQYLLSEHMELKSQFKELLHLSRHFLKQQKEMLENFRMVYKDQDPADTSLLEEGDEKEERYGKLTKEHKSSGNISEEVETNMSVHEGVILEEFRKWSTYILPTEEARLQVAEERWKRLRMRPNKGLEEKRLPLDILRSHFAQILAKLSSPTLGVTTRIMSSSESTLSFDSLISDEQEEQDISDTVQSQKEDKRKDFQLHKEIQSVQNLDLPTSYCSTSNPWTSRNSRSLSSILDVDTSSTNSPNRERLKVNYHKETRHGKEQIKDNKKPFFPIKSLSSLSGAKVILQEIEDTSLQSLFERNPELRQEGKTCSVIEVLEPSSSENEEISKVGKKTKNIKGCKIEKKENGNSSSSSVQSEKDYRSCYSTSKQKLVPAHQRSSSGDVTFSNSQEKKQGPNETQESALTEKLNQSSRSQHHHNPTTLSHERSVWKLNSPAGEEVKQRVSDVPSPQETQVKSIDVKSSRYLEPDLIRETKVKSFSLPANHYSLQPLQRQGKTGWRLCDQGSSEMKSPPTRVNQPVQDQPISVVELNSEGTVHSGTQGSTAKMKGFLSKFSLKGRWASKHKSRSPKKLDEISADEFREMYSRSAGPGESKGNLNVPDLSNLSSQDARTSNSSKEKSGLKNSSHTQTTEDTSTCKQHSYDVSLEDKNNGIACMSQTDISNQSSQLLRLEELPTPSVLLPPRGEPPPAPPVTQGSGSDIQNQTEILTFTEQGPLRKPLEVISTCDTTPLVATVLRGQKRSKMPTTTSPSAPGFSQTLHEQDCHIQQSFSVSSKNNSLSRPASSASWVESPPHSEDNDKSSEFPLRKAFSASSELLITPDSSTAGRQSPAPSEVSKTESALSPPSDVSKTESTRHLHHLGKIEEIVNRESSTSLTTVPIKEPMEVKTAAIVDITQVPKTDNVEKVLSTGHESDKEKNSDSPEPEHRKEIKVKNNKYGARCERTEKPWYEVSDEEDMFSPDRYHITMGGSSDDDRQAITS